MLLSQVLLNTTHTLIANEINAIANNPPAQVSYTCSKDSICSRASQMKPAGRMQPAGCSLPTPAVSYSMFCPD